MYKEIQGQTTQIHREVLMCLRPVNLLQGGHEVMSLVTGKRITCTRIVPCKMNEAVVKVAEDMAENQGISSLKFSTRRKESILLQDSDMLTGVRYE